MSAWTAALLFAILFASVMTAWVPLRWPASILEVGSFALAAAWVAKLGGAGKRPRFTWMMAALAITIAWGAAQLAFHWAVAGSETVRAMLAQGANLAILFVTAQALGATRIRQRFLGALLWTAMAIAVLGIVQSFTSNGKVFWIFTVADPVFVMGPFVYHNHYAAFVEALLPLALIAAIEERDKRLWYSFAAAAMIASVIVSASRSGFAIVAVETIVVVAAVEWKNRSGWRRAIPAIAAIAATTVGLTVMAGWDALGIRFQEEGAYFDRLQMLRSSVDMFRDHAWTGVGLGNWPVVFPFYARFDNGLIANQAHNDWAQAADEGGVVGLAAFVFLFACVARIAVRNVWCVGLVFVFLHALIDYPFHKPAVAAVVFAMAGAGSVSRNGRKGYAKDAPL